MTHVFLGIFPVRLFFDVGGVVCLPAKQTATPSFFLTFEKVSLALLQSWEEPNKGLRVFLDFGLLSIQRASSQQLERKTLVAPLDSLGVGELEQRGPHVLRLQDRKVRKRSRIKNHDNTVGSSTAHVRTCNRNSFS